MTSIRLPDEMETRLDKLCALTKRSKSFYIKEALAQYLEDVSDYYIAMDRLAKPGKFYTTKELLKALESRK